MMSVKVEMTGLESMMRDIKRKDMPRAVRNTLRDIMKDTMKREQREMRSVFKNPTRLILNGQRITKLPQDKDPSGEMGFKDVYGRKGEAILNALSPHIPGYQSTRNQKGMAVALTAMGLMTRNQYLVPSKTMRLNKFGNITGAAASKMLNDVGASKNRTGTAKTRYIWGEVQKKGGGTVKGIWLASRFRNQQGGALQMVVVDKKPSYSKRFRYKEVARSWGDRRAPYFARETVNYYITKKYGR